MTRLADAERAVIDPPLKSLRGTTRHRLVRLVQRVLLATARTPLRRVWTLGYRVAAHLVAALLVRGEAGATVYGRASLGSAELLPGLSDIDLALVLATDDGADRVRRRWARLGSRLTATGLVDTPFVFSEGELRAVAGRSVLTYGEPAFGGPRARHDLHRMLQRPELEDPTLDWRRLRGPDRRPPPRARDVQERRIAAWLDLVFWWRFAYPACAAPPAPWLAGRCVRLVAGPGLVWLALAHGERPATRDAVLQALLRHLPEEEAALRATLALHHDLHRLPEARLDVVVPLLIRLSDRIAALLAEQLADAPLTEVALTGERVMPPPLVDWREVVIPQGPGERLQPLDGDPSDPAVLAGAALGAPDGVQPVLRSGRLLLLPGLEFRPTRLRAIQCRVTDPVSFALLDGEPSARFPDVAGWSIGDMARRAVAEHAARLRDGPPDLDLVLTAARAALLHESVRAGEPELVLGAADAAARLPGDAAAEAVSAGAAPPAVLSALREQVLALPAFSAPAP